MLRGLKHVKKFFAISLIAAMTASITSCGNKNSFVQVYETTGTKSKLMERQTDLTFNNVDENSVNAKITIDDKDKRQSVQGFGAAITHASADVLLGLSEEERDEILNVLFSADKGAGYDFIRIPIGSSDYVGKIDGVQKHFTYDDMPEGQTDEKLENFKIDPDKKTIIPIIKKIKEINPDLKIVASPWSAPAWMKTSGHLFRGSLIEEYEDVYAEYLSKYLKAYKEEGIDISYITLENEPLLDNRDYPVMQMDEYQEARVVKALGKKLKGNIKDTQILIYDFNYSSSRSADVAEGYIKTILSDKDAAKHVGGVAFHGYENEGLEDFAPGFDFVNGLDKMSLITEIAEGKWSMDFAGNLSYSAANMVIGPLNHYCSGTIYWNSVLNDDGTPVLGGGENSLGIVSVSKDKNYTLSGAYYSMTHLSKFLESTDGDDSIVLGTQSESPNIIATTIKQKNGKIVTAMVNISDKFPETIDVVYKDSSITYTIQPQSIVSFVWEK